jgi:hypothetical protein
MDLIVMPQELLNLELNLQLKKTSISWILVVMPQELLNLELNFNSRRLQSCGNGCGPTRVVEP